jgi:integrase
MAVIKCVIRESDLRQDNKCNIKIRVTHQRESLYISTNFYIEPKYFDNRSGTVKPSHSNSRKLNIELMRLGMEIENKLLDIASELNKVDIHFLKTHLVSKQKNHDAIAYIDAIVVKLKAENRDGTARAYNTMRNHLHTFHPGNLTFNSVDHKFLTEFHAYLIKNELKTNSLGLVLRCLRAAYNGAINDKLIGVEKYPFRGFRIKVEQSQKRNLPPEIIRKIYDLKLSGDEELARDVFMLSFFLMAMNIIDLYNLKKTDVVMDRLDYKRRKTGQTLSMLIQPEALILLNKYSGNSKYLLTFHSRYKNYVNLSRKVNEHLSVIGRKAGLKKDITFYYARHSFSSIGISLGINKDVIGRTLSHSTGSVTDTYTSYDPAILDAANRKIIDHVLKDAK